MSSKLVPWNKITDCNYYEPNCNLSVLDKGQPSHDHDHSWVHPQGRAPFSVFWGTPRCRTKRPFYTQEHRENTKILRIWCGIKCRLRCDMRCKLWLENYGCGLVWAVSNLRQVKPGEFQTSGFPFCFFRERSWLCREPFRDSSSEVLWIGQEKRKRTDRENPQTNRENPEKREVPKRRKKDKSGRTSQDREALFETPSV